MKLKFRRQGQPCLEARPGGAFLYRGKQYHIASEKTATAVAKAQLPRVLSRVVTDANLKFDETWKTDFEWKQLENKPWWRFW